MAVSGSGKSARGIDPGLDGQAGDAQAIGARVGGYRLAGLLGEGGAARVFAAEEVSSGRKVALKRLRRTAAEHPEGYQRLLREAEAVRRLAHPGVVAVYETGLDDGGYPYLVMERVAGRSLKARLLEGPLPPSEAWQVVRAAAGIVHAAHEAGVLHRDLTPGNVLIEPGGRVRLTDFGLARHDSDGPLTRTGDALGTPAYMAPEQWWGAPLDARTDVYGLGAVLYEALSGKPPWSGVDAGEMLHRIATLEPPSLRSAGLEVSIQIDAFVLRCLARVAAGRPESARAFLAEGDEAFGQAVVPEKGEAKGIRVHLEPALVGLAIMAGMVGLGFVRSHDPVLWGRLGGPVCLLFVPVLVLLLPALRWSAMRVLGPVLLLALGAIGNWAGFRGTMRAVGEVDPATRFLIFQVGLSESSANLFIGAGLSAMLITALAWGAGRGMAAAGSQGAGRGTAETGSRGAGRDPAALASGTQPGRALSGVTLGPVAILMLVGGLSGDGGALAVCLLAAALILRGIPARDARGLLASLAAVGALACSMAARQLGDTAYLWRLERVERATALQLAPGQWTALIVAIVCSLAAVAFVGRRQSIREVPRVPLAIGTAGTVACALALGALVVTVGTERRSLWAELAPRFSLWSELSPPEGQGTGEARVGPTLQLGRRMIAVDGQTVAPLQALEGSGPTGPILLAQALAPRLQLGGEGPELVLACDRTVAWRVIARALATARELGVRRMDVLYLPGPVPILSPLAPPEASFVLPKDLRALQVTLAGSGEGQALYPAQADSFAVVASRLAHGPSPTLGVEAAAR